MNMLIEKDRYPFITFFITFFSVIYTFLFHIDYPISTYVFLFAVIVSFVFLILGTGYIMLTYNSLFYLLVAIISIFGMLYTNISRRTFEELLVFCTVALAGISLANSDMATTKLVKWIFVFTTICVMSVIFQLILPRNTNGILKSILTSGSYEIMMISYRVGGYAGFAAYTSFTGFFAAVVFGHALVNLQKNKNDRFLIKKKTHNVIMLIVSLSVTVLSNKRSLFLACIVSMIIVLAFVNRKNKSFVLKLILGSAFGFLLAFLLYLGSDVFAKFIDRFSGDDITTGRSDIYAHTWSLFLKGNKLLGNGTASSYYIHDTGIHNIYIQLLYDYGYVGLFIYAIMFLYNYVKAFKSKCEISIFVQSVFLIYGLSGNPLFSFSHFFIYTVYVQFMRVYEKSNKLRKKEQTDAR